MIFLFSNISTWLIIELVATSILVALNLAIPTLMAFTSYRNIVNFYFSSAALSSSLLNCLYIYYLVQTLRSRGLSENNCRAIYYLQTSCTVVLAYTITAMHANFVLCLLSSSSTSSTSASSESSDSHNHHSNRSCLQSCGCCLRKFFRRFCFCAVLCVWSLSFTATIPLLYTIDSNEKSPKPVYCPGTTQITYLEEWFDRNRVVQSIIFNLTPLLITFFLSALALLKLFYDAMAYFCYRFKRSKYFCCRRKSNNRSHRQMDRENFQIPNSVSMLSSLGILSNSHVPGGFNFSSVNESPTPTSEQAEFLSQTNHRRCSSWCSKSFLRFVLVLSCCLLACIYPIAMRFYLVYFSVLVPLMFAIMNYSLGQLNPSTTPVALIATPSTEEAQQLPTTINTTNDQIENFDRKQRNSPIRTSIRMSSVHEEFEMDAPLLINKNPSSSNVDEREELLLSPSNSSPTSTFPKIRINQSNPSLSRTNISAKQKYFSNTLYENCNRNNFLK